MKKSASEVIRNLGQRIDRLERNASSNALSDFIDFCIKYDLQEAGDLAKVNQIEFLNLIAKNKFGSKGLKLRNRQVMLTSFGEQVLNENMRVARLENKSAGNMKDLAKSFDTMVDCMLEAENKLDELTSQKDAIVSDIGERRYNLLIKSYNRVLGVFDDAESVSLLLQELNKKRIFRS